MLRPRPMLHQSMDGPRVAYACFKNVNFSNERVGSKSVDFCVD